MTAASSACERDPPDTAAAEAALADQRDTARFIETCLLEMRTLANRCELAFLRHLIDQSLIEASDVGAGKAPTPMLARRDAGDAVEDYLTADEVAQLIGRSG